MNHWLGRALAVALSAMLASTAQAAETVIASNVHGPEGPLFVDGKLYYVAWSPGSLSVWDGKTSKVINDAPGCSHNGLALTRLHTLLLACSDAHGAIVELDLAGKELRRWQADDRGQGFDGGINDIVVAANGGAYATVFGPFTEKPTEIIGRVLYMAPDSDSWAEVANDLNYANGVAVSPDQKTLYVDEMGSNAIITFAIGPDGKLSNRANFVRLDLLAPAKAQKWWAGPDSLKADSHGNLYVAQYYGGRILKVSPKGSLLHVFDIAAGNGTTNVAFGPGEKELYVSVVKNGDDLAGQASGSIVRISNVP
jgi:gluconolactonase